MICKLVDAGDIVILVVVFNFIPTFLKWVCLYCDSSCMKRSIVKSSTNSLFFDSNDIGKLAFSKGYFERHESTSSQVLQGSPCQHDPWVLVTVCLNNPSTDDGCHHHHH